MQRVRTVYSTTWEEKTRKATNPVSQIHSTPFGRHRQHDWPGQAVWIGTGSLWLEEARSRLLCSWPMMMVMMINNVLRQAVAPIASYSKWKMALTNVTKKEDSLNLLDLRMQCSAEFTGTAWREIVFLSVVNFVPSITAFLGNTLILVALHKESLLHLPSKLLYRNLAITELSVGLIVEPLAVTYWISVMNEIWDICYYADLLGGFLGYTLCAVSFFTLTVISVDRLLQGHPTRI